MSTYSKEIVQCAAGYIIKNYKKSKIISHSIMLFLTHFLVFIYLGQIIYDIIKNNRIEASIIFPICFIVGLYYGYFTAFNDIRSIFININTWDKNIIFRYGLFPFTRTKKIEINSIKEISINHSTSKYTPIFIMYAGNRTIKETIYNVDIIDKELNAYRLYQSTVYNDDLINYSKAIGEIIKVGINDQNDKEGNKNIYKKVVI